MRDRDLAKFIIKRENVRAAKEDLKQPKPWTNDPILQRFRFCNVHREDDAVTRWIAQNWRTPHADDKDLWFAMAVSRFFNLPASLDVIGYPVPWRPEQVKRRLTQRREDHERIFNGAYIVSTNGIASDKVTYVVDSVLTPLWKNRDMLRPRNGDSLHHFASRLLTQFGFKGFMTGQVVADIKYVAPLLKAPDWETWALSGPGSRRGLNRVMNRDTNARWNEQEWHDTMTHLRPEVLEYIRERGNAAFELHMQDLQNCLCEFDKYERARLGEGRPKSIYPGV